MTFNMPRIQWWALVLAIATGTPFARADFKDVPSDPHCHALLSPLKKPTVHMQVDASVKSGIGKDEQMHLALLRNLLADPSFRTAVQFRDKYALETLQKVLQPSATQRYYRTAIEELKNSRLPVASAIEFVERYLVPEDYPSPARLPQKIFEHEPAIDDDLESALRKFYGDNERLDSEAFTRRLMAYLGRYPDMQQGEKHNFIMNVMAKFDMRKGRYNSLHATDGLAVKEFGFSREEEGFKTTKGTQIICGVKGCRYFYAITADGKLFKGAFTKTPKNWKFDRENWQKADVLQEATGE